MTIRLFLVALLVNLFTSALLGYHDSAINIPRPFIQQFLNESYFHRFGRSLTSGQLATLWSVVVSGPILSGIPFAPISVILMERLGRKITCVYLLGTTAVISGLLMGFARWFDSFEMYIFGRFMDGIPGCLALSCVPVYLTECSPPRWRGVIGSLVAPMIAVGLIIGSGLSFPELLGSEELWPFLAGGSAVFGLLLLLTSFLYPRSPKYLYIRCRDEKSARRELAQLYGSDTDFDETLEIFAREELLAHGYGLWSALKSPHLRDAIVVCLVVITADCCSGWVLTDYYSASVFREIGVSERPLMFTVLASHTISLTFSAIFTHLIDTLGRRPLIHGGLWASAIAMIGLLAVSAHRQRTGPNEALSVASIVFLLSLSIANTPASCACAVLVVEIVPQNIRSLAAGLSRAAGGCIILITTFLYPILQATVGSYSIIVILGPLLLTLPYLWFKVPETKGRTVEDIVNDFMQPIEEETAEDETGNETNEESTNSGKTLKPLVNASSNALVQANGGKLGHRDSLEEWMWQYRTRC